ncbi:hypothetical protein [Embleya sp. MST-111070]|uniref:hypothetical protein n=1 Tax=Embleya sp. MST-111070 TaxID=3398231 RepID=UPI003F7331F2
MRRVRAVAAAIVLVGVCASGCAFPGGTPENGPGGAAGATRAAATRPPASTGIAAPPASTPSELPPTRTIPPPVSARSGVDFADPAAVAGAFAEVYLSYRWDQDPPSWQRELARFATETCLRSLPPSGATSARGNAGWRAFAAKRGVVTVRIDHAEVVPAAPNGPDTVFVQVSAWQVMARDGEVNREDPAPLSVELRRASDGTWRVARATSL